MGCKVTVEKSNFTYPPLTPPIFIPFKITLIEDTNDNCPSCLNTEFKEDIIRAETYCAKCGTVLSAPYPFVAGNKIILPFSYNYYIQQNFETEPIEGWAGYSKKAY